MKKNLKEIPTVKIFCNTCEQIVHDTRFHTGHDCVPLIKLSDVEAMLRKRVGWLDTKGYSIILVKFLNREITPIQAELMKHEVNSRMNELRLLLGEEVAEVKK